MSGNIWKSDLYGLHNYTQNTLVSYPKQLFIETLREFFSQDSYYHYQRDEWGYAKVPDHTDLEPDAGLNDDVTTRIFIGEAYRYDVIYYPALLVKAGSFRSVPISMNRNKGVVQWGHTRIIDGYGNSTIFSTPEAFVQSGAWEGQISIDIETRSMRSRDELSDLICIAFVDTVHDDLKNAGVLIKSGSPQLSSPSEGEDRNDKLFKQTVTFDIRGEWNRRIPTGNVIDVISLCVDLGNLATTPPDIGENIRISTTIELLDAIQSL